MGKLKRYALFFALLLVMLLVPCENYYAQTNSHMDDPEFWKAQGYVSDLFYEDSAETTDYVISTASNTGRYTRRFGIDVSKYQGNIDWAKAKANGVEFAIIRVGYRGSSSGTLNEDEYYKKNIEGALAQGIRVGVYIFSQAITEDEAIAEANYVISRVYKYNITLPIVIDYEYSGSNGTDGRLFEANLSKDEATAVCKAFCETVKNAGYTGMVYANRSMLTSGLNAEEIAKDYHIWLAHYTATTNYTGTYDFWQYSSKGDGQTYGMQSQYVDMNYWYDDGTIYGQDYSAVFDSTYYANRYTDLKTAYGSDVAALFSHFINHGMEEGRQGCATFSVQSYKNTYRDLRAAYGNDLKKYYLHYIKNGKNEGRVGTGYETTLVGATTIYKGVDYSKLYNPYYYLNNNKDVYEKYGYDDDAIIEHFVNVGMQETRQGTEDFNVISYKNLYRDLRDVYGMDWQRYYMHYINYGKQEGRVATGYEDTVVGAITTYKGVDYSDVYDYFYYITNNPDVFNVYGYNDDAVLEHFVNYGMQEGRQGIASFNVNSYKNRYSDLRKAYGMSLKNYYMHYIYCGKREGRIATGYENRVVDASTTYKGIDYSAVYNYSYYVANNPDVYKAYGYDDEAVLSHFVNCGMQEGRQANSKFNVFIYKNRYTDLSDAFGDDLKSYYIHYINLGKNEGRIAN